VYVKAELVLERHAADAREVARATQRVDQLEQRLFPLPLDDEVDVLRVERCLGVKRRKVTAPGDRNARILLAGGAADRDRALQLRAGHDGDAEQRDMPRLQQSVDRRPRVGIDVAIDNLVLFAAFEHRGKMQDGQRQPPVLRLGAARMEQYDHAANLPARIQNREGGRLPFQRAFHGRNAHCTPYHGL
jgi:hypothetical protein